MDRAPNDLLRGTAHTSSAFPFKAPITPLNTRQEGRLDNVIEGYDYNLVSVRSRVPLTLAQDEEQGEQD
jgi:hypothetical protein